MNHRTSRKRITIALLGLIVLVVLGWLAQHRSADTSAGPSGPGAVQVISVAAVDPGRAGAFSSQVGPPAPTPLGRRRSEGGQPATAAMSSEVVAWRVLASPELEPRSG